MNSLICFTFLLVISTGLSDLLGINAGVGLNVDLGLNVGGGGGGGGGGGNPNKVPSQVEDVPEEDQSPMDDVEEEAEEKVTVLNTPEKLEYHFFPVSNGRVFFEVKAPNDAHVALTTGPTESKPLYEILIGSFRNTRTIIRKDKVKKEKAVKYTTKIVNKDEFSGFFLQWDDDGTISVTRENDDSPFISWTDPEPISGIKYIGVCTAYGATGTWRMRGDEVDKDGNAISSS